MRERGRYARCNPTSCLIKRAVCFPWSVFLPPCPTESEGFGFLTMNIDNICQGRWWYRDTRGINIYKQEHGKLQTRTDRHGRYDSNFPTNTASHYVSKVIDIPPYTGGQTYRHTHYSKGEKGKKRKSGTVRAGIMHTRGQAHAQKDKDPLCINHTA